MSKVVYSYESITSDLKVWAVRSPLSTWTNTTIINKLNFQIILNRPKPKVIKGNLRQLENLIESLVSYVDNLLNSPLHSPSEREALKLFHRCHIPNLRQFSGLEFSTLELFDLITNLELLTSEVQISPTLDLVVQPISPIWLKVAIAAIATVGITSSIRFLQPKSPQYVISSGRDIKSLPQSPQPSDFNTSNNSPQAKKQLQDDKSVNRVESKMESPIEPKLKPKFNSQSTPQDRFDNLALSPSSPISKGLNAPSLPIQPQINPEIKPQVKNNLKQEPQPLVANPLTTKSPENLPSAPKPAPSITIGATREPRADRVNTPDQAKSAPNGQNFNRSLSSAELTRELPQETGKLTGATSAIKDQNSKSSGNQRATPRIEVLKITGSPSDLQVYKQKLEALSNLNSFLNPSNLLSEISIQVRWQNRQITEINVVPENMELTEFVRRSLLETFTDQNGNIDISLKIINP